MFNHDFQVWYHNYGNTPVSGTVTFNKDAIFETIATSPPTNLTPTGFTYGFVNLQPFESRLIMVSATVPLIPTVSIGQLLNTSVSVAVDSDILPDNNNFSLTETIVGSYDPNDKMEAHGPQIVAANFNSDDYLTYTIRFENTGTPLQKTSGSPMRSIRNSILIR